MRAHSGAGSGTTACAAFDTMHSQADERAWFAEEAARQTEP
jgi:hypothetical protein